MFRILIVFLMLSVLAAPSLAHSPSNITAELNKISPVITISVFHSSNRPENHYVNKVIISYDDRKVLEQDFTRQYDKEKQVVMFLLPEAAEGGKLKVKANCNKFGSKTKEIILAYPKE